MRSLGDSMDGASEIARLRAENDRLIALLAALDAIDAVIKIVRASEDDDDAKKQLIAKLKVVPHGQTKAVPIDDDQKYAALERFSHIADAQAGGH